jgi:hypothetical protein
VWVWQRANKLALLRVAYNTYGKTYVDEEDWVAQPLSSRRTPSRAYRGKVMVRHMKRHAKAQAYQLEINKCSLN